MALAASTEEQFRSGIFFVAISEICALVILPTKAPLPTVAEPYLMPDACFRK